MLNLRNVFCLAAVCFCACGPGGGKPLKRPAPVFMPVEVPAMYESRDAKAAYMGKHYWDNVDFSDTAWVSHADVLEEALPDYLVVLQLLQESARTQSIDNLLGRVERNDSLFTVVTGLLEKYLYDPNSPMRNEDIYIPVLEYLVESPAIDSLGKVRPRYQLDMAMKNRPGDVAADFAYALPGGATGRLSKIRSPYTLIYFYNPECHGCAEIIELISRSQIIGNYTNSGQMTILALFVDEDKDMWRRHLAEIPGRWTVACDPDGTIKRDELYDMRAIPTIYLLDAYKRVLLKDCTAQQVEAYLMLTP